MVKEDEENATNGEQQDRVQKETAVVSSTMEVRVENQHQSRLLPLNRTKMVKNLRERRISEVGVLLGTYLGNRAKTTSRVSARDSHVILGIPRKSELQETIGVRIRRKVWVVFSKTHNRQSPVLNCGRAHKY